MKGSNQSKREWVAKVSLRDGRAWHETTERVHAGSLPVAAHRAAAQAKAKLPKRTRIEEAILKLLPLPRFAHREGGPS
jgi:hypothetical protein